MVEESSRKMNYRWTTKDIMVTAIISVAMGFIFIPISYLNGYTASFPLILAATQGICFFPTLMIIYLIRKPGVALFSTSVCMLITVPLTPWGLAMLLDILTIGVPLEIIFLVTRYKNFKLWYMMLAGVITSGLQAVLCFVMYGMGNMTILLQIIFFIEALISGALLGGLVAKLIGDVIFKTGVISKGSENVD
ncbi:ECF transporter S component [Methanobacterium petrolearium]|uniref:ECF transporter S component n=1 Tax=Methanobacterium petrolearium TaxID=710190 RepID=UPI001AE7B7B9|nr:ECF transporter S component [Methanobacterium petrolearium]MBP1946229.1 energy-coupling factor transport system substrate-specific component [Methanobacterium petrolearium]BDZ71307.1 putative HMP/thiamine permease protein YkoE [Methanobacterium petrolearium]